MGSSKVANKVADRLGLHPPSAPKKSPARDGAEVRALKKDALL